MASWNRLISWPIVSEPVDLCEVCECADLRRSQMILTLLDQITLPYKTDWVKKKKLSHIVVTHDLCWNGRKGLILTLFESLEVLMTRNHDRNPCPPLLQLTLSPHPFVSRSLVSSPSENVDYAMQNVINRGFLFAGSFFFFLTSYTFNSLSKV